MNREMRVIGLLFSMVAAGCGGGGGNTDVAQAAGAGGSSAPTPTPTPSPTPTPTPTPTPSPSPTPTPAPSPTPTPTPSPSPSPTPGVGALYISPGGNDSADCKTTATACKTFAKTFPKVGSGGELVLMDGVYTPSTTGIMNWDTDTYGSATAQIPAGTAAQSTYVHALNFGKATVQGELFIGRSTRKDSYIVIRGLDFVGNVEVYNTSFVTIKDTGVNGALEMGTNDHDMGNTNNLIEDVWVWAAGQRAIVSNYRSSTNVWRRLVVRGDGCGTAECAGDGNPNVGITVYDSHDVTVQNVIVLDRILKPSDGPYADFAIASHTGGSLYYFGRNEWLGTISLNAPDAGYYFEPDVGTTVTPTIKISNAVAWSSAVGAFNLARSGSGIVLQNLLATSLSDDTFRVAPELAGTGTLANVIVMGAGRYGLNSAYVGTYTDTSGSYTEALYNQTTPTHAVSADPVKSGSLKYVTRIEAGSPLKGAGASGADVGATIVYRYGLDGTRFGDANYNTLSTTPLWPWPNEARIKTEMCAGTTRGFCSAGKRLDGVNPVSLSSYVWEITGQAMPSSF